MIGYCFKRPKWVCSVVLSSPLEEGKLASPPARSRLAGLAASPGEKQAKDGQES